MDAITIAKIKGNLMYSFRVAGKNGKTIRVIEDIKEILLYVNNVYVGIIDNLTTADYVEYWKVSEEEALKEAEAAGISQGDVKLFVRSPFHDEGQLLDVILDNAELLTCFNCGEKITEVASHGDVGVLNIDPGENNYPHSPDVPTSASFTCFKCIDEPSAEEMAKAERRAMGLSGGQ